MTVGSFGFKSVQSVTVFCVLCHKSKKSEKIFKIPNTVGIDRHMHKIKEKKYSKIIPLLNEPVCRYHSRRTFDLDESADERSFKNVLFDTGKS